MYRDPRLKPADFVCLRIRSSTSCGARNVGVQEKHGGNDATEPSRAAAYRPAQPASCEPDFAQRRARHASADTIRQAQFPHAQSLRRNPLNPPRPKPSRSLLQHAGTKIIASDVPSGYVSADIHKRTTGMEERQNPPASAGLRMPRHTHPDGRHRTTAESADTWRSAHAQTHTTPHRRHTRAAGRRLPTRDACDDMHNARNPAPNRFQSKAFDKLRMSRHTQPARPQQQANHPARILQITHAQTYTTRRKTHKNDRTPDTWRSAHDQTHTTPR